jgi:hypothetical protein
MTDFFPEKLSAIEQYLFVENRASFPLDFYMHLTFDAEIDTTRLQAAFLSAADHHPLLRAIVTRNGRHYEWQKCDVEPTFQVHTASATAPRNPIDLGSEPGVRLIVVPRSGCHELVFQFQHTATDGLGAMGFISDVFLEYARHSNPALPEINRDATLLAKRHLCGFFKDTLASRIRKYIRAASLTRQFFTNRVFPMVPQSEELGQQRIAEDYVGHHSHTFDKEESDALRRFARQRGVSLNSLLTRDAFIAIDKIRKSARGYTPDDHIRIAIPGNQRSSRSNARCPAANFFSMIFPSRTGLQMRDQDRQLRSVHEEIREGRTGYHFAVFIFCLKLLRLIPGGIERNVKADKCLTTLLLTNFGDAVSERWNYHRDSRIQLGGAVVQAIDVVAPMRPFQSIAVATIEHAGEQTVTLSYDPRVHSDAESADILQRYVRQIRRSVCSEPVTS